MFHSFTNNQMTKSMSNFYLFIDIENVKDNKHIRIRNVWPFGKSYNLLF